MNAATYNRTRFGTAFTLADLPATWTGTDLLRSFDQDEDLTLSPSELARVDWAAFSREVEAFQQQAGFSGKALDGKLGPATRKALQARLGGGAREVALHIGDLDLPRSEEIDAPAPQPVPETGSQDRRRVAFLWNHFGDAVAAQAKTAALDPASALAVFAVESGRAYDAASRLVVIRFESRVFLRRSGRVVPPNHNGQIGEWSAFQKAYALDARAALESTSYGLPQLMGFNFGVTRHQSPRDLIIAFQRSVREQVAGFFGFVAAKNLADFIRKENFVAFARRYNGLGKETLYAAKMRRYLASARDVLA